MKRKANGNQGGGRNPLVPLKHRIIAALLCLSLLMGVFGTNVYINYNSADSASALTDDESTTDESDNEIITDENILEDEVLTDEDSLEDEVLTDEDNLNDDVLIDEDSLDDEVLTDEDSLNDEVLTDEDSLEDGILMNDDSLEDGILIDEDNLEDEPLNDEDGIMAVNDEPAGHQEIVYEFDQSRLQVDKYLNVTGEINKQDAYDVYFEQTYYNNTAVATYAPARSDIIMLVDCSSSLTDYVDSFNIGLYQFFTRVCEMNQMIEQNAADGLYVDIDPASVADESDLIKELEDHYIYINAEVLFNSEVSVKYDESTDPVLLRTADDVESLYSRSKLTLNNITISARTDLGTKKVYDIVSGNDYTYTYDIGGETVTHESAVCVLFSAGKPENLTANFPEICNTALAYADKLKNKCGAILYACNIPAVYYDDASILKAMHTGNIRDIAADFIYIGFDIRLGYERWQTADPWAAIFYSIWSSDYRGGVFDIHTSRDYGSFDVDTAHGDGFGNYFYYANSFNDIDGLLSAIPADICARNNMVSNSRGYLGSTAKIADELSDVFSPMGINDIMVYAVPRIPETLNNTDVPTDMDPDTYEVSSFRWGERYLNDNMSNDGDDIPIESEWIDVTDQVSVMLQYNRITVTGWDYEANAATSIDKDILLYGPDADRGNDATYKTGDYGYKLVVIVRAYAKFSFGGNNIRISNPDISGVLPSVPSGLIESPEWADNEELNDTGSIFIGKYPEPTVDFNTLYAVAKDSLIIYAPQTEVVHDLVTDAENGLWFVEDGYYDLKDIYEKAIEERNLLCDKYNELYAEVEFAGNNATEEQIQQLQIVEASYISAQEAVVEAKENFTHVAAYKPDGLNNAFVDIDYELEAPDGNVIAVMHIPHGRAYNGSNIDWEIYDTGATDADGNYVITQSGIYTVTATVTPVDTDPSPEYHVATTVDGTDRWDAYPYDAEDYSPVGSTAAGTGTQITVSDNPEAYLFTLKLMTADTRKEFQDTIDFDEGPGFLIDMTDRQTNTHITGYEWVCTDGSTLSDPANEPGITGINVVGEDVTLNIYVPEKAIIDGLATNVSGKLTVTGENGSYVPVCILAARTVRSLNKADAGTMTTPVSVVMGEDDNVFGYGQSSIEYVHICDIMTDHDCNEHEFAASHVYDEAETSGNKGKVQFLIHIEDNPAPGIEKSTTTPVITKGGDIKWEIKVANSDDSNTAQRYSEFSLVDILPYQGDERNDDNMGTLHPGSRFGGTLYYKGVSVDFSEAPLAQEHAVLYYTSDDVDDNTPENQLNGSVSGINWTMAEPVTDGSTITFSVPMDAVAIRLDTRLDWKETMRMNLTANIDDTEHQNAGDYYHNQAVILYGKGSHRSNVSAVKLGLASVSGTVWVDNDANGLMTADEEKLSNIKISFYEAYDSNNMKNPVTRMINGLELVDAYDLNDNPFVPYLTGDDGTFSFESVPNGTYYIVADLIPDCYDVTKQHTGGDTEDAKIGSKAESQLVVDSDEDMRKTAWIKSITVEGSSVSCQNIGLKKVIGNIKVGLTLNEIYYPSSMTPEQMEDYRVNATFILTNTEDGTEYRQTVYLHGPDINPVNGSPQVWAEFKDLPLGIYELTEAFDPNYHFAGSSSSSGAVNCDNTTGKAVIEVTAEEHDFSLTVENTARPDPPAGDENGVQNRITIRTPVKLDVIYVGDDPLENDSIYEYSWVYEDFDPKKGGDIVVTYDDGTQISLSKGTLDFENITWNPDPVTNLYNSDTKKTPVTGYYTERGHTVKDTFEVKVQLKPLHKFRIRFFSNGSEFDNNTTMNVVEFVYSEVHGCNIVTSGVYKDENNTGLKTLEGFWQAGWNTKADGSGKQYGNADGYVDENGTYVPGSAFDALDAIGKDFSIESIDLYANWMTYVTFDANGGVLSEGIADWEIAANGAVSVNRAFSKTQSIATNLTTTRANHQFLLWNTQPDGRGEELSEYNKSHNGCQEPVTFYAIYMQTEYPYTGTVQTFTAPLNGVYQFQLWGAQSGGYTTMHLDMAQGETIYVIVGGWSKGLKQVGYNGGGAFLTYCDYPPNPLIDPHNDGSGGGMTHISRTSNVAVASTTINGKGSWNPAGTIAVAGGGGGGYGGYDCGGGLSSPSVSKERGSAVGATQTSGWSQGCGRSSYGTGGGGGGWYGGNIAEGQWLTISCCNKATTGGSGYINPNEGAEGYENYTVRPGETGYSSKPCEEYYGYGRVILVERK